MKNGLFSHTTTQGYLSSRFCSKPWLNLCYNHFGGKDNIILGLFPQGYFLQLLELVSLRNFIVSWTMSDWNLNHNSDSNRHVWPSQGPTTTGNARNTLQRNLHSLNKWLLDVVHIRASGTSINVQFAFIDQHIEFDITRCFCLWKSDHQLCTKTQGLGVCGY